MSQTLRASMGALPPGPKVPSWWQLLRFAGDPLRLLDECHERYGDAFTINAQSEGPYVMLSDPQMIREVFQAPPNMHSGEATLLSRPLSADVQFSFSMKLRTPGSDVC